MFKTFLRRLHGSPPAAPQEFLDRGARAVLEQQIRDAEGAIDRVKWTLALVIEHDDVLGKRKADAAAAAAASCAPNLVTP